MRREVKNRVRAAFLLLLMLTAISISSLHVHPYSAPTDTECSECLHHVCHGHLTQSGLLDSDCVICQFLTVPFLLPTAFILSACLCFHKIKHNSNNEIVIVVFCEIKRLRAPPAIF